MAKNREMSNIPTTSILSYACIQAQYFSANKQNFGTFWQVKVYLHASPKGLPRLVAIPPSKHKSNYGIIITLILDHCKANFLVSVFCIQDSNLSI